MAAGPRTLVQDLGRPGLGHLAVSPSGALDMLMLRRANALVGNTPAAAGLEVLLGGLVLVAERPVALAVVGSGEAQTHWLEAGQALRVPPSVGLLSYVAVRGGVGVAPVLGSRSTDLLAGLGPAPLADGDVLGVGGDLGPPEATVEVPPHAPTPVLRLLPAPRPDELPSGLVEQLVGADWVVGPDSGRTAVRLEGPVLSDLAPEVPPEGLVRGAVQLPPSGRPVVFLADHPVTGGYPVVGVVASGDLRLLAQLRPGSRVRFRR